MSDNDNIVDLRSRRPLGEIKRERDEVQQKSEQADIDMAVETFEKLIEHAKAGTLTDFIVIARNPATNFYYSDLLFNSSVDANKAFALAGVLETMKLELTDVACAAPAFLIDGTIFDPMQGPEEFDE